MLNLVINQTEQASASEDDYLTLEFRHNAYDDEPRTLLGSCVIQIERDS